MKLEKVTIVLLVIINLSLLTLFGSGLFNQVPGQVVVHDLKLDHLEPVFGDSQELVGDTGTLFVFFHADSSCQCLDDWSNWVKTNNYNPKDLRVVGIFNGKDIQKFEQFASGVSLHMVLCYKELKDDLITIKYFTPIYDLIEKASVVSWKASLGRLAFGGSLAYFVVEPATESVQEYNLLLSGYSIESLIH